MLLGHMVQSYESSNNGNGVYDLITSGTISCDTNFDSYLTDFG
uniref:Uncharacterized protein n=1 Tax=Plectus sambesii TaxID=2011161 RepID=A0A914VEW5_9BILA